MEHEPTPEAIHIQCDHCQGAIPVTTESTWVYAFMTPKDYRYSFATTRCQDTECQGVNYNFVDVEDVTALNEVIKENVRFYHSIDEFALENNIDPVKARQLLREYRRGMEEEQLIPEAAPAETKEWGEAMLNFLNIYNPEAWEFGPFRW